MKVSVIIAGLMLGLALLCKALGPREASELLLWLNRVMIVVVRRLLVFWAVGTVLVGEMAGVGRWRPGRRTAEVKEKLMKARGRAVLCRLA